MINLKMFTLLERLEPGYSAKARLLFWNGQQYVPEKRVIEVHDHLGHYGLPGERGHCLLSDESGQWEVFNGLNLQLQQLVL
jgi:hypothetical protein